MPRQQKQAQTRTRMFTASEVADFEYCPLAWWHEQFEPWAQADSEELFARLVELEHEHNTQAPALPEYRMIEQLLLRLGAFEEGRRQHREHATGIEENEEDAEELEEEIRQGSQGSTRSRWLAVVAVLLGLLAILMLVLGLLLRGN
jgi:hypothetical protein